MSIELQKWTKITNYLRMWWWGVHSYYQLLIISYDLLRNTHFLQLPLWVSVEVRRQSHAQPLLVAQQLAIGNRTVVRREMMSWWDRISLLTWGWGDRDVDYNLASTLKCVGTSRFSSRAQSTISSNKNSTPTTLVIFYKFNNQRILKIIFNLFIFIIFI